MYIIVKFIDAIIVLAILLVITLTIINSGSYSSMLDIAPKAESHVTTSTPSNEDVTIDSQKADIQDISINIE